MGLISFLKEKFAKRREEKQKAKEEREQQQSLPEEAKEEPLPESPAPSSEPSAEEPVSPSTKEENVPAEENTPLEHPSEPAAPANNGENEEDKPIASPASEPSSSTEEKEAFLETEEKGPEQIPEAPKEEPQGSEVMSSEPRQEEMPASQEEAVPVQEKEEVPPQPVEEKPFVQEESEITESLPEKPLESSSPIDGGILPEEGTVPPEEPSAAIPEANEEAPLTEEKEIPTECPAVSVKECEAEVPEESKKGQEQEAQEDRPPVPEPEPEEAIPKPIENEKAKEEETKPQSESEQDVMDKYVAGLDKSRMGFTDRIRKLANANKVVNREYFDSLERILIEADVGVDLTLELIKETASEAAVKKISDPHELNDLLIDKMFIGYANEGGSFSTDLRLCKNGPTVVFMAGVNGGGKTTTTAKLAKKYKDRGLKILLVAADTFRAGAVEQLAYWAKKVGVDIISRPGADPASLCFDAMKKALDEKYDLVFIDTAGRLQNKKALMDELSKVVRVIKKVIPDAPHEALLVIDANTGQNGIDQAMVFKESVPLTGIVITKMDGTSKGGILLSIRKRLTLPVRFIGLGEKMDDLEEFDLDKYLYGLLIGDEEE